MIEQTLWPAFKTYTVSGLILKVGLFFRGELEKACRFFVFIFLFFIWKISTFLKG